MENVGAINVDTAENGRTSDERLARLFEEINAEALGETADGDTEDTPEQGVEAVLDATLESLPVGADFQFDEMLVKDSLDEVLLLLIAMRSRNTNGKHLMADLQQLFDSNLSPGTVYPRLHEMEEDGVLEMFELVRSKEYRVDDREAAEAKVMDAARQHLALGAFFYAAAAEL